MFELADYDYELPADRIAQTPASPAHNAKLLVVQKANFDDKTFRDLPNMLPANSSMYFNESKVLKARILLKNFIIYMNDGTSKIIPEGEVFFLQ